MTIADVRGWKDLMALAAERGVDINGQYTWAIVEDCVRNWEYEDCNPGPDEEIHSMVCRMAVRNADPDYRGYTPWGRI